MPWTTPTDRATGYVPTATDWNVIEDNLAYLYGDAGWTAVSAFTNGWGASASTPGFILLGRVVHLRGALTAGTAGTAAFTLPAGYRPTQQGAYLCSNNATATANEVTVSTAGVVTPLNSAVTYLHQISFPVV